ncbi:MAG: hypothetical protein JW934_17405 [Anaerolineae bacterium]|nr:hypothetical protein [Anaerolineae bacterium]
MSAAEVTQNAQQALGKMQVCHAVLNVELNTEMFQESLSIELWERYPEWLRFDLRSASSPQLAGIAFTTDGETSILYSPHSNVATVGPADAVHMPQVIETIVDARRSWLREADPSQAELFAKVRENGLMVYKIDLTLRQHGSARYTIDAHHWWVRQIEYEEEYAGKGVIRLESMDCFDKLDDALFNIDIPEGATLEEAKIEDNSPLSLDEAQKKVSFKLRIPDASVLPEGTRFLVAYQLDKNMALVYTGPHSFTLVQGPNIGRVPEENATPVALSRARGVLIDDPEHNGLLLTWREDNLQFSIAGSLDRATIEMIANSLK